MADSDQKDDSEYVLVTMRYKGADLGFAMRPELMDCALIPTIQKLRECVMSYRPEYAQLYRLSNGDAK